MKRLVCFIIWTWAIVSCTKPEIDTVPFIFQNTPIAEFNGQAADDNYYYYLEGTISEIIDVKNSRFMLEDETGSVLVYGLWQNIHGKRIRNMGDYKAGDRIAIAALKGKFANEPYAKEAYVTDAGHAKIWVTPTNAEISCEGGGIELKVFSGAGFNVAASESWIKAGEPDGNVIPVTVDANESIFARFGYINVRSDGMNVRVKVTQAGYVPQTSPVKDALLMEYAHIEGTVLAVVEDGYLLADKSGVIFVETAKFNGIYAGATLSVTGRLETADYMTRLIPELTKPVVTEPVDVSQPKEIGADDINRIIAETSSKDSGKAGNLKYEFVRIKGTVVFIDGKTRLVSEGRIINVEPYKAGSELNFDNLNGHTLELDGYLISLSDGMLKVIVTSCEDIPVESLITVDGDYSDWDGIEDRTSGNDMSASHNLKPVVKLHCENGYVYGYIRVDKSEENGGFPKEPESQYHLKIAGRFYVWIDNDDIAEGQGGGWLFDPQRYDNVLCYRITSTAGGWTGWATVAPRANEYYGKCVVGNKHTDDESDNTTVGYMATTVSGDILEGEFSFLAAKVGLFGKDTAVIGLEIGWDNGFNTGAASLGKKGYEISLND